MRGCFCQDDAGHWYLIPKEKVDLAEWEDRQRIAENIIDEFEQYRISGGVGDYEVTINE
jgi:hypothetical protein